jgi:N6-adenosine-specific RNA methylase IME4
VSDHQKKCEMPICERRLRNNKYHFCAVHRYQQQQFEKLRLRILHQQQREQRRQAKECFSIMEKET